MAGFTVDPNAIFKFDNMNANFDMDPNISGEEVTNANQGITSHSGEGASGDAGVPNPISHDNDPFMGLGALVTNDNYNPALPIDEDNDLFMPAEARTTNDNSDPDHGQIQHQQVFQESVGFNQNAGLVSETSQVAANDPSVEEEDWFKLTDQEEVEAFNRLMEMSPEEFEEMMRQFPDEETTAPGPSSATPYAISKKRVRLNEGDSAPALAGGALSPPQLDFETQQIDQIRQIREAKSRRGKAIEGLEKRVQDLEVDLAKAQSEAKDAFENGRMVALLGVDGDWEAREAKLKQDAQFEHERQINAVRSVLEGQIAEKNMQLDQYRAEAEAYKVSIEGEAGKYKQAAEAEIEAQKAAVKVAEGGKNEAESILSEKARVLDLAKPYVEGLEKKIAELGREKANWEATERLREEGLQPLAIRALEGKIGELEAAAEKTKALLGESKKTIAKLEKEQSSKGAEQLQREEELQQSAIEARKALEGRIKDLESTAEKATRAEDKATQSTKGLNEELQRLRGDLKEVQLALRTKTDELERARYPQQLRETQSIVGPIEQVNVEPSNPASDKTLSAASFTFVAAKELPTLQMAMKPVHPNKSRRQLQPQPQPQPELKQEPEAEPKLTSPSQLGMFSRQFYPPVPANRPRRIHIHAEEAIRNRFHIPLDKVHAITSKLDKIKDLQGGAGTADEAGLIISAELTGVPIRDLKVMRSLRMSFPGSSSNPKSIMAAAQLELPKTLVDLLASENRPAIRAFLDGASFPQSQASSDIARDMESRGTQTEALDAEAEGVQKYIAVQEEEAVVQPGPKQSRCGSLWKILIPLCLLWFLLPLLLTLPWSSPIAWLFEDPDPNSGWFDYVPPPSPWSGLIPDFSGWPVISKFFGSFFEDPDLEIKWCGNIPMG